MFFMFSLCFKKPVLYVPFMFLYVLLSSRPDPLESLHSQTIFVNPVIQATVTTKEFYQFEPLKRESSTDG